MKNYLLENRYFTSFVCILHIIVWGTQVGLQLLLILTFRAAISFDFKSFMWWTGMCLIGWAFYFGLNTVKDYFQFKLIFRMNDQMRKDMLLSFTEMNYSDFHEQDTGNYLSLLTHNVKQIERFVWIPFFECIGRTAQILWSIIVLAWIDIVLLFVALATALIMWVVPKLFEKRMRILGSLNAAEQATSIGKWKDLLEGINVFRTFNKLGLIVNQGSDAGVLLEQSNINLGFTEKKVGSLIGFISVSLQILSQVIIVSLAFMGRIEIAVLAGGSNLIGGVSNGFDAIAKARLAIASGKAFFLPLKEHNCVSKKKQLTSPVEFRHSIQLNNLSFQYSTKPVLESENMTFLKGRKYALVGPSGSGKTTLLKILLGWLPEYDGTITFDGINAREFSTTQLQSLFCYIDQNSYLFHASIKDNISLWSDFNDVQMEKAIERSALNKTIEQLHHGIDTVVGEGGKNLSGGQRQRVSIARALLHNRSVLLIDEGTSSLDRESSDFIEQCLLQNKDLTLILVSHHLTEERKQQFDKIYYLN